MQLYKTKFIPLAAILTVILINLGLYKFHAPTNQTIDELWVKYTFKSVDQFRISQIYKPDDLRLKLRTSIPIY
ncbi:unnamed protein product [Wickerhamomyces anomalus]